MTLNKNSKTSITAFESEAVGFYIGPRMERFQSHYRCGYIIISEEPTDARSN